MFCDEVKVNFIAGKGGNGCIGFRREKFIPRGGPDGGDGGKGGSLYLVADQNINTLAEFNNVKVIRAKSGEPGLGKKMGGKDADDLYIKVPVGTLIYDESKKNLLADLAEPGDRVLIARGGRGGYGNWHFKSSTRQAPTFAELGEPGEYRTCVLELKLVADVGFIGLPSVGKSTLLSRVSNARPKIAAYHFTTIIPNLGLVTMKQFGGDNSQSFVACDLPGLIEGAHAGKGLGIQFLKHVARNRVLVHLIDVFSSDPIHDYRVIRKEIKKFDAQLGKKPEIVVFNKIDAISEDELNERMKTFKKKFPKAGKVYAISCITSAGLSELMFKVWNTLEGVLKEEREVAAPSDQEFKIFRPALEENFKSFKVKKMKGKVFEVQGGRIEQIVVMTNFANPEAVSRVYDVFEKMGIAKELRRAGAKFGDTILVRGKEVIYRW